MCNLKEEIKNIVAVILALFLIVLIFSIVLDIKDKMQQSENRITVYETGTVYAKPDTALVNFSVVTEKKTVAEAVSENAKKMNSVIDFMKDREIEEKDIKTVSFNVYPRYEWPEMTQFSSGERVLVGYEVRQSLEVKIRDLEKTSEIIDGATVAGANEVSNLQFTIDNQDELKKEAREQAISKAKDKAEELAEQLDVKLLRISSFSESSYTPYYAAKEMSMVGLGGAEEVPQQPEIQAGESKIEIQVYITYEIN